MDRFESNLKLARFIAHRYSKNTRHEYDDIYQVASLALWQADKDYIECKVPFGSFAAQRMVFAILNYRKFNNFIKTAPEIITIATKIKNSELEGKSAIYIAETLKEKEQHVELALEHLARDIKSIEFKYSDDEGDERTLKDTIPCFEEFDYNSEMQLFLDSLSDFERRIYEYKNKGYTDREISEFISVTREKVTWHVLKVRKRFKWMLDEYKGVI